MFYLKHTQILTLDKKRTISKKVVILKNIKLIRRQGSIMLIVAIIIASSFLLISISSKGTIVQSVSDNILKDQALVIDNALNYWFSSHGGKYPNNLSVLQDMNFISSSIQLNLFTYALQNNQTEYKLTIPLKNGSTYTSLGSKF